MRLSKYVPFLLLATPLLFTGCTSMLLVKSMWSANKIIVDGKDSDWGDTMFYIPSAQMTAGVRNDSKYLYLILKTTDRRQAFQIRGLGLTVWFDPTGGAGQKFGIHFPVGRFNGANFRKDFDSKQNQEQENATFVMRNPNELELLGVNPKGPEKLSIADLKGIQLQMRGSDNGLIYELRVPLHSSASDPYAINPKGDEVGIGIIGGTFKRPSSLERRGGRGGDFGGEGGDGGQMPGGMEGDGYGGGEYGGGDRGGYRGEGPGQFKAPKQIDFWLRADLSSGPYHAPTIH